MAVGSRERTMDAVGFGAAVTSDGLGNCPQRASGRYLRARLTLPAGASFTHISGIDVDAVPEGAR